MRPALAIDSMSSITSRLPIEFKGLITVYQLAHTKEPTMDREQVKEILEASVSKTRLEEIVVTTKDRAVTLRTYCSAMASYYVIGYLTQGLQVTVGGRLVLTVVP